MFVIAALGTDLIDFIAEIDLTVNTPLNITLFFLPSPPPPALARLFLVGNPREEGGMGGEGGGGRV